MSVESLDKARLVKMMAMTAFDTGVKAFFRENDDGYKHIIIQDGHEYVSNETYPKTIEGMAKAIDDLIEELIRMQLGIIKKLKDLRTPS